MSFESLSDLRAYNVLATPIWIFDVDRNAIWWGNRSALDFWGAACVADLRARDFSLDSGIVQQRLRQIVTTDQPDFTIEDSWTLYPRGAPRTVKVKILPVLIEDGWSAILVEVVGLVDFANDPGGLRMLEAARISPLMISTFREDGQLLVQNPAASGAYGVERQANGGEATTIFERYSRDNLAGRLLGALREDRPERTETQVATSSGLRWHRVHASRGRDPLSGNFVLVVTEDDISATKNAEEEAQRTRAEAEHRIKEGARLSEARLREAIEAIPDGFSLFDAEDRLVLCNQRYRELYSKHADVLVIGGRFENMLRIGVARGEFAEAIGREEEWIAERMQLHANPEGLLEQELSDGRWLRTEERRTRDGETVGLRTDITQFKALQLALKNNEARFRDFAEAAADWFWEMDADLRFTYMSENVARIVGVPAEWHYGKSREDLLGDDYDHATWDDHLRTLREHLPFRNFEYRRVGEGVETKWLRASGVPVFDQDGEFAGYRGTGADITDQKRAQEQLLASETQLLRAQKMEAIGKLTGGVAHDFNNLLAVILGNLELLKDSRDQVVFDECLHDATDAAQRGATLTRHLLSFGRRAHLRPEILDLNEIVLGMRPLLHRAVPANIKVETTFASGLCKACVDRSQLENALLNLTLNARDAMPDGGKLTFETANARLIGDPEESQGEGNVAPGRYVLLTVTDTGCGMSDEVRENAFEPFFTTKSVGAGSGMGLSMVQGFVKQSGGAIRLDSQIGKGATIRLYFPIAEGAVETRAEPARAPIKGGGERILLVEDDEMVRRTLMRQLERLGYDITEADCGDAALEAFVADPDFDLVVTDIVMPGTLQGPGLAKSIRQRFAGVPIIFMSGYPAEAAFQGNSLQPGDIQMMKPVQIAALASALRRKLDQKP